MSDEKEQDASESIVGQSASTGGLCRFGWHRPLFGHANLFVDCVSGKQVFSAECICGKHWMVDSMNGWLGFKVARPGHNVQVEGAEGCLQPEAPSRTGG